MNIQPHNNGFAVLDDSGAVMQICETEAAARGLLDPELLESTRLLPKMPPRPQPVRYGGFGLMERRQ